MPNHECGWQSEGGCDESDRDIRDIRDAVNIILTDVEMPEMDGYALTLNRLFSNENL